MGNPSHPKSQNPNPQALQRGKLVRIRQTNKDYHGNIGVIVRKSFTPGFDWLVKLRSTLDEVSFLERDLELFQDIAFKVGDRVEIVTPSKHHAKVGTIVGESDASDPHFDWKVAFDKPVMRNHDRDYDFEFGSEELQLIERK